MEVAARGDSAGSPERRADPKTRKLIAVQPDTGLDAALALMVRSRVRHLAVLDRGRCVGVVHETDLLWRLAATPMATLRETVVDVSRPPVPVVDSAAAPADIAAAMRAAGTDMALVRAEDVVGIVTVTDLLRFLAQDAGCPPTEVGHHLGGPAPPPP